MTKCPCKSDKSYEDCCMLYHEGAPAPSSLLLMKSRYSAYALKKASYIIQTTHPQSVYYEKNKEAWKMAILAFSEAMTFENLKILSFGLDWVQFIAYLKEKDKPVLLREKSFFIQENGKWLYHSQLSS